MIETLLGIDIGTTSSKAVLFDLKGGELASAASPSYHNYVPNPGWVEQDPEEIFQAVLHVIQEVIHKPKDRINVLALCLAAQSGSLLPANSRGEPLYRLITWMDGRTAVLVKEWQELNLQAEVKATSGWSLYPGLCLPTIAWLRNNNHQVFSQAKHYFSINDYIAYRLTGEMCQNPSNAGGMQLVNISNGQWSDSLCTLAGITSQHLSPIQPTGSVIGKILPELIPTSGLTAETLVINGGHDQGCTALGLGINSPGKFLLACGTAWVITGIVDPLKATTIPPSLDLNFHTTGKHWTISQSLGGLGAALEWWGNQAWQHENNCLSRKEIFKDLNRELAGTIPGSSGILFLPLTGGHNGPATTRSGAFLGLQLGHTRADLGRAVQESAAFELRWALEGFMHAGVPVERLWMVGGAADSPLWPAILANVNKIPLTLPKYGNWPALGAAIIAGSGVGVFKDIDDGLKYFQKPSVDIAVDKSIGAVYEGFYRNYKNFSQKIFPDSE